VHFVGLFFSSITKIHGPKTKILPLCFVFFILFPTIHLLPLYIVLRGPMQRRKFHLHPVTTLKCLALRFSWRWNVWSYTCTNGLRLVCCLQRPFKHTKLSAIKKKASIITWNDSNKLYLDKGTRRYCNKPVSLKQDTWKTGISATSSESTLNSFSLRGFRLLAATNQYTSPSLFHHTSPSVFMT